MLRKLRRMAGTLALAGFAMIGIISMAHAADESKNFQVGYKKGFFFKSPDDRYSLKINGRLQLQYLYGHLENINSTANFDGATNTFMIRRLYVYFSGTFFDPKFSYLIQLTPVDTNPIADVYINYTANPEFSVLGGSFKIPMNRQEFTSSGKQQFVERSLANKRFNLGQSIGSQVYGTFFDNQLEYYVFLTNGRATDLNNNDINEMLGGVRIAFNPMGDYGYSEGDVDYSTSPALTLGLGGAAYKEGLQRTTGQDRVLIGAADAGFKYLGFSFQGEFFVRDSNPDASTGATAGDINSIERGTGYYAQAGYFIIPHHFEVAARGSSAFYSQDANDHEFTGGLNYFFSDHALKLQLNYLYILTGQTTGTQAYQHESQVRLQSTMTF